MLDTSAWKERFSFDVLPCISLDILVSAEQRSNEEESAVLQRQKKLKFPCYEAIDSYGNTLLHIVARFGREETFFQALICTPVPIPIDVTNFRGQTPLTCLGQKFGDKNAINILNRVSSFGVEVKYFSQEDLEHVYNSFRNKPNVLMKYVTMGVDKNEVLKIAKDDHESALRECFKHLKHLDLKKTSVDLQESFNVIRVLEIPEYDWEKYQREKREIPPLANALSKHTSAFFKYLKAPNPRMYVSSASFTLDDTIAGLIMSA